MAKSRRDEPKGRDRSGTAAAFGVLVLLLLAAVDVPDMKLKTVASR